MLVGTSLALAACSSAADSQTTTTATTTSTTSTTSTSDPPTTSSSTTSTSTTTSTTTTTTTTVPPPTVPASTESTTAAPAPVCTYQVQVGDSLNKILAALNIPAVTLDAIVAENGIADPNAINAGAVLDVCPGNGIDDTTGAPRVPPTTEAPTTTVAPTTPDTVAPGTALPSGVEAQQTKLNALFANLGLPPLAVDGRSGRLTRQQLCAARVALNLPINRLDMAPGSPEEQALMAANSLPTPPTAPVQAGRWVLIDQTCQVMFVGDGPNQIQFVFQTSTGKADFPTRNQTASRVFRYDPAANNGGWHDSTQFPAAADNPLNGNMYKPIYFHNGEAIHGANTVPTSPASHGCARLHIADQDALVTWLGLADNKAPVWSRDALALTVTVQGAY